MRIANAADGEYVDGNDTQVVVDFVLETLKNMDKKEFEAKKFVSYKDQFHDIFDHLLAWNCRIFYLEILFI